MRGGSRGRPLVLGKLLLRFASFGALGANAAVLRRFVLAFAGLMAVTLTLTGALHVRLLSHTAVRMCSCATASCNRFCCPAHIKPTLGPRDVVGQMRSR